MITKLTMIASSSKSRCKVSIDAFISRIDHSRTQLPRRAEANP